MYTVKDIEKRVRAVVETYNKNADPGKELQSVRLFGSYANGHADDNSDIDLLVTFRRDSVGLFTLAKVLGAMEEAFDVSVDVVHEPIPEDSLLVLEEVIPLYEQGQTAA